MSACSGFVLDAVLTFSRVLTLGTNDDVATTPSEKLEHADTIPTCHFASSMHLIFSLFSHYRLITSKYKCVICVENMSIYLGVVPHHHQRLPGENFTHRLPRPAAAWILQTRVLGGRGTFTSFVTYHRTTSHRYTRVSHEDQECKFRMFVKLIVITHWLVAFRVDVQ